MFENPRRGRQGRNFTTNAPKILDLKLSFEQIFSRKLPLGAPVQGKVSMTASGKKRRNKRRTIELIISRESNITIQNISEKNLANLKYKYKQELTPK